MKYRTKSAKLVLRKPLNGEVRYNNIDICVVYTECNSGAVSEPDMNSCIFFDQKYSGKWPEFDFYKDIIEQCNVNINLISAKYLHSASSRKNLIHIFEEYDLIDSNGIAKKTFLDAIEYFLIDYNIINNLETSTKSTKSQEPKK